MTDFQSPPQVPVRTAASRIELEPGTRSTEWRGSLGAALLAVIAIATDPEQDLALRAQVIDLIGRLVLVYVVARSAVKVAHLIAQAIACKKEHIQ